MLKNMTVTSILLCFAVIAAAASRLPDSSPAQPGVDYALADISSGPKPGARLRTDEVIYLPGDQIRLWLDLDHQGHLYNKTFYLYLQNMATGEARYMNVDDGILAAGVITDLSGNTPGNQEAVPIPSVQNFPLIGDSGLIAGPLSVSQEMIGNHRFVLELRDVSGRRVFHRSSWGFAVVNDVVEVPAEITQDTIWTSDSAYLLNNRVTFVREGADLTIEPGTHVLGTGLGTLVIDRGARILAHGTQARPIIMTSAQPVGERQAQDWGGLILNGRAPVNIPGGVGEGEGDTGLFGGNDPHDDSGVLRYVRVEFAGIEFSPDNELNGIAFQGVGDATVVENIQVHFNKDDGVEFFGGTVNARWVYLTSNADDSLDWTEGWTGKIQFLVIQQNSVDADNGLEADNNAENNELTPRSSPTIYNATLVGGNPQPGTTQESDNGLLIREGTQLHLHNAIIIGFGQEGLLIDQDSTIQQAQQGNVVISHSIFFQNATREPDRSEFGLGQNTSQAFDVEALVTAPERRNRVGTDPGLRDPFNLITPDLRPGLESAARDVNYVRTPPDDGFFEPVTYLGGIDPLNDWTADWTTSAPN